MELGKIFVMCIMFLFGVIFYPILNSNLSTANVTGPMAPIIHNFALIFLIFMVVFPVAWGMTEEKG